MKRNLVFLLAAFLFIPAALKAYEFDASAVQPQPFDDTRFEFFQDDINGYNAIALEIETDLKDLKFDGDNNAVIKDIKTEKGYIVYVRATAGSVEILGCGFYPYVLKMPKLTSYTDKKAFKINLKSKGKNPAEFSGAFAIASVKDDKANLTSVNEADGKPVIVIKTDLPFAKIDGLIFKETGAFLMGYEDCGPFYYTVLDGNNTLKDVLLPEVITKKSDGSSAPAKDNAEIAAFKLLADTTYYMTISWGEDAAKPAVAVAPAATPAKEVKQAEKPKTASAKTKPKADDKKAKK